MTIKIVIHYKKSDPKFWTDYVDVELFIDDKLTKEYSDAYHDDGLVKAKAFAEGYLTAKGENYKENVIYEDVADRNIDSDDDSG